MISFIVLHIALCFNSSIFIICSFFLCKGKREIFFRTTHQQHAIDILAFEHMQHGIIWDSRCVPLFSKFIWLYLKGISVCNKKNAAFITIYSRGLTYIISIIYFFVASSNKNIYDLINRIHRNEFMLKFSIDKESLTFIFF